MASEPWWNGQSPEEGNEPMPNTSKYGKRERKGKNQQGETHIATPRVNNSIREYFDQTESSNGSGWLSRHEIPSSAEVLDEDDDNSQSSAPVELNPNQVDGPWQSKDIYLQTMYELLREDAIQPLREAVSQVRHNPNANEDAYTNTNVRIGIYGNVHICGVTTSRRGVAIRVTFSLARIGKRILWKQSKRLLVGGLVVLSPKNDAFEHKAIVASVAARSIGKLEKNPPEIDLFFARTEELEIDPAVEYVMVEERSSFYEAQRHTLCALQKMMQEPFPLSEHLVGVRADIPPPSYVQNIPEMDLSAIVDASKSATYKAVDVINSWPIDLESSLDASQLEVARCMLTKRLAIVHGPPGTGKTFVSVQTLRVMLASQEHGAPPIIIACQTNHAIDQLLRYIADFETDFVRLGGMSKDRDVIKPRTLFEVRRAEARNIPFSPAVGNIFRRMKALEKQFELALHPLQSTKKTLDHRELEKLDIISKDQADSLEIGASKWIRNDGVSGAETSPFMQWLGDKLVPVPLRKRQEDFGFEYEETEIAYEHLKELEAEAGGGDEEYFMDDLTGDYYEVADNFTCRKPPGVQLNVKDTLKEKDLWKIPHGRRGAIYRYLQDELKKNIRDEIRNLAKRYNALVKERKIGLWEESEIILKNQKIIGMTTTGLSKYRALLSALGPRVVLIEEAAETLEPPVTVACLPSVQHLILVGDHQQLRPHTKLNKAFKLDISLFERMMMNNVEHSMLKRQRRMIPEIRRLLYPIYGNNIEDHPSVTDPTNRPDVAGMGGINSFFFSHNWKDQRDELMSAVNPMEAEMIAGFVWYLFDNGASLENITILTFYNGQRKRLIKAVRDYSNKNVFHNLRVATVDSYQGEENDIVILSLVRSNPRGDIGFLGIDNRVCVSLSRAKRGFYIFGNADLLQSSKSRTWKTVIQILLGKEKAVIPCPAPQTRLSLELPICCQNHHQRTGITNCDDWEGVHGGCKQPCTHIRSCGHPCEANCHPWPHEDWTCGVCDGTRGARHLRDEVVADVSSGYEAQVTQPKMHMSHDRPEIHFQGTHVDYEARFKRGNDDMSAMVYKNLDDIDSIPLFQQMPALRAQLHDMELYYAKSASREWQRAITAWYEKFDAVSWRMNDCANDDLDYSQFKSVNDIPDHLRVYRTPRPGENGLLINAQLEPNPVQAVNSKDWSREKSLLD